ncbi:MAG: L-lactate dehydrogenase complex protein LldG [Acidimicrobiia bacterium]|nr:L-lactate dehydrogenase complex protein LldG [Acidimicrobiia bacterium]
MERQAFLEGLRARLSGGGPPPNLPHPIPPASGVPPIGHPRLAEPPVEVFAETAAAHAWNLRRVVDEADLARLMAEVCEAEGVRSAVLSGEPEAARVGPLLQALGVEIRPWGSPADAAGADLGVTGAVFGLAATGSVAVSSSAAGGRSVSLLPPVHLALVPASRVVASASEVWRRLPECLPDGLPSQLVFISGPSRSADIEFTLTVGVHGPKRVWLALLDNQ